MKKQDNRKTDPGTDRVYAFLEDEYYRKIFENRENDFRHNPYNHELREGAAVEKGDEEELKRVLSEDFSGRYGTLAGDPLRQEINIGIVAITVVSRAAIRGGLRFEEAFTISDICIQEMEKCKPPAEVRHIYRSAEFFYTHLVHELKINEQRVEEQKEGNRGAETENAVLYNRHIEHCKDYIFSHMHGKITVREIADNIGLEPNYLSALFHRSEKITIKQYIMKEKINLVQKMLMYSPNTFTEIATYFGFASQSHMGAEFKKITGMTPRQYRERYRKEDFLQNGIE